MSELDALIWFNHQPNMILMKTRGEYELFHSCYDSVTGESFLEVCIKMKAITDN